MRTDIVFVHPDASALYQNLADAATVETPVWAAMLTDYCRRQGHTVAIIDQEAERLPLDQLAQQVASHDPLVVAVVCYGHHPSASTQVMPAAYAAAKAISACCEATTTVALVGGHVAALPERSCREGAAQVTVTGEGFRTLDLLVRARQRQEHVSTVPGVVYRHYDSDVVYRSPAGEALNLSVAELDQVRPAYDLLPMRRYRAHNWHALGLDRSPYASLYTSLGCPYDCSFCCIQAPFRAGEQAASGSLNLIPWDAAPRSYRRWSAASVVKSLGLLRRAYGVRNVKIADELFVLSRRHVTEVCQAIVDAGLTDLNLWAYARVDTVPLGMELELARAGFRWLAFGIESAAESIRDQARKSFTLEKTRETIRRCHDAGIHVIANYVFGLPGETRETMEQTLELAKGLNTEFANFYCASPYPGSALYDAAVSSGAPLPANWSGYHQYSADFRPLPTEALDSGEIVAFRDRAFHDYHGRASYLEMIERRFGVSARAEVTVLLQKKLRRDR